MSVDGFISKFSTSTVDMCIYIYIFFFLNRFFFKQRRKHTNHGFRFEDAKQKNNLVFVNVLRMLESNFKISPNFFLVAAHEDRVDA